jgi:hypothetical protein
MYVMTNVTNTDIIPLIFRTNNTERRVARAGFVRMPRESQGHRHEYLKQNILILSAEKILIIVQYTRKINEG